MARSPANGNVAAQGVTNTGEIAVGNAAVERWRSGPELSSASRGGWARGGREEQRSAPVDAEQGRRSSCSKRCDEENHGHEGWRRQ